MYFFKTFILNSSKNQLKIMGMEWTSILYEHGCKHFISSPGCNKMTMKYQSSYL